MALFEMFKGKDMAKGLEQYRTQENAVLLDVRDEEEYAGGHIPGAQNVPLSSLRDFAYDVPHQDTPIYVYCLSGNRSFKAATVLRGVGYTQVHDLGGIDSYHGELEK